MGEAQNQPFQLSFNGSLRVDFQGARATSDGGLILGGKPSHNLTVVLRGGFALRFAPRRSQNGNSGREVG